MTARRAVLLAGFLLWAVMTFLTLYVLVTEGPDVLVAISLVMVTVLGAGIFGAIGDDRRGGRR